MNQDSKDMLQEEVISLRGMLDEMRNLINEIPENGDRNSYNSLFEQIESVESEIRRFKNTTREFKLQTYGKRSFRV